MGYVRFNYKGSTPAIVHDPLPGYADSIYLIYRDVTNDNLWGFSYSPVWRSHGTPSQVYNFQSKYTPGLIEMNSTMYLAFADKKKSNQISISLYTTGWTNYTTYPGTAVGTGLGAAANQGAMAIGWIEAGLVNLGQANANNLGDMPTPSFSTSRAPALASDGGKKTIFLAGRWGTTDQVWFSIGYFMGGDAITWRTPEQIKNAHISFNANDPNSGYPSVCYYNDRYLVAYRSAEYPNDYETLFYSVLDDSWTAPSRWQLGDAGGPPSVTAFKTTLGYDTYVLAYTNNQSYLTLGSSDL
jgi:hypothetical protein